MSGDISERAELIVGLQDTREHGACIPLEFAAREIGRTPIGQIIAAIEAAQAIEVNPDVLNILPEAMERTAHDVHERLAGLLDSSTQEAAAVAQLNASVIVDHAASMGDNGAYALVALGAMHNALRTALEEAKVVQHYLAGAVEDAQAAAQAQALFIKTIDGYIETI